MICFNHCCDHFYLLTFLMSISVDIKETPQLLLISFFQLLLFKHYIVFGISPYILKLFSLFQSWAYQSKNWMTNFLDEYLKYSNNAERREYNCSKWSIHQTIVFKKTSERVSIERRRSIKEDIQRIGSNELL